MAVQRIQFVRSHVLVSVKAQKIYNLSLLLDREEDVRLHANDQRRALNLR